MEFDVIRGDIAEQRADALVNAAGIGLQMRSGAAGLGFETGAETVCEEIDAHEPTTLTDVRVIAYSSEGFRTLEAAAERVRSTER